MSEPASRRRAFAALATRSLSPLVVTCEHATNRLPFAAGVGAAQRRVLSAHWGWDIGAWALTRVVSGQLGASAIGGAWSRLLIDLNRRADDPTLIRPSAGGVALPWNHGLGADAIERRILDFHTPYHLEIDRLVLRRLVRGVRPLLFAIHSFTPELDGRPRRFDAGILYERDRDLARRLGRHLREAGLRVRYNQPYSGMAGMMYAVDRHGSHHRLPCLELEINHALLEGAGATARLGEVAARGLRALLDDAGVRE